MSGAAAATPLRKGISVFSGTWGVIKGRRGWCQLEPGGDMGHSQVELGNEL